MSETQWIGRAKSSRVMILALVMLLLAAVPAYAYPLEEGYRDCGSTQWVKVKSQTKGNVGHHRQPPGQSWQAYAAWNDTTWTYHYSHTGYHATGWRVHAQNLNYTQTYSYCTSIG